MPILPPHWVLKIPPSITISPASATLASVQYSGPDTPFAGTLDA